MPNLVVYVSASTWKAVEDQADGDVKKLMRELSIRAIEEFVGSEGADLPARDVTASRRVPSDDLGEGPVARAAKSGVADAASSPKSSEVSGGQRLPSPAQTSAPSETFKPDFKKGKK